MVSFKIMPKKLNSELWKKLLEDFDTIMLDCDGVLWKGNHVVNGSPEAVDYLRKQGKTVILLTNNSTKSRQTYAEKCTKLGFNLDSEEDIITTSRLGADYLKNTLGTNQKVFVVGSSGIGHELDNVGIKHIGIGPDLLPSALHCNDTKLDPEVKAVVVGFDPHFSYPKLLKAASYLKNPDCLFIATNDDETIPETAHPELVCPGTGCFVAAISVAAGRKPVTLGKPYKPVYDYVSRHFKIDPGRTLMVGDRIRTDIQLARNFGMRSLLVLTGVTRVEDFGKDEFSTMLPEFYSDCFGDFLKFL